MSSINVTNYNIYDSYVRLRVDNSNCNNTSSLKYNCSMPDSNKYNRRKSDIRQVTQNFKRGLKNYIVNSMMGALKDDDYY